MDKRCEYCKFKMDLDEGQICTVYDGKAKWIPTETCICFEPDVRYYISTYYDDFYIVNPDGSYVVLTPACDYRKTKYDWKHLIANKWWAAHVRIVTKKQFYIYYDAALRKRSGL